MSQPAAAETRSNERVLRLDFECLRSIDEGINEVRVWHDRLLDCDRVGKRIDLSALSSRDVLPEPATLQQINHDHVVPIHAAARVEDPRYTAPMDVVEIVTPYYPLGSVTDALLRGDRFTATQAVKIAQATLRGLDALHETYNIGHRDMKSGNVLLTGDRHVAKVADLGLAGRFDDDGVVPALDNPTPYSPQELVTTGRLTRASDIYPVGLILRELLGGPFPYAEYSTTRTVETLMRGHCPITPADRELPVWASRSMRRVHAKATATDWRQRYQRASEMDEALARVVAVDWVQLAENRWEAPFTHQHKRISIETRAMRNGQLRVATLVHRRGWRRAYPDQDVSGLGSTQARALFDQANDIANAR